MIRNPHNTNQTIYYGSAYQGLPIQADKGPFIQEYLERLHQTMNRALAQYPRVFAFRFDLRLPLGVPLPDHAYTNVVIERFIESFKAKIKHNRRKARLRNKYAHDSEVRYVWAREVGQYGWPHHHGAILLNRDAFNSLGWFVQGGNNMCNRLEQAWASALDLPIEMVGGLVHIPNDACYRPCRDDVQSQAEFFFRASYLCKAATKVYGDGSHGFGASRI